MESGLSTPFSPDFCRLYMKFYGRAALAISLIVGFGISSEVSF